MDPIPIDASKIDEDVPVYSPLLSKESLHTGLGDAPMALSGSRGYCRAEFYSDTGRYQDVFLKRMKEKASDNSHNTFDRFTEIDEAERGLIEYYNSARKSVHRIKLPSTDPEWSDMKYLLDTSRLLVAYGLLHAKQFLPFNKKDKNDHKRLEWYICRQLIPLSQFVYKLTVCVTSYLYDNPKAFGRDVVLATNNYTIRVEECAKWLVNCCKSISLRGIVSVESLDYRSELFEVESSSFDSLYSTPLSETNSPMEEISSARKKSSTGTDLPSLVDITKTKRKARGVYLNENNENVLESRKKTIKVQAVGEHAESNRLRLGRPSKRKVKYLEENAEDLDSSNAKLRKAYMIAEEEAKYQSDKMENTANIVNVMTQKDEKSRFKNDPLLCFALSAATTLRPSGSSGGGRRAEWDNPIKPRVVIKFGNVYNDTEILRTAKMMQEAYSQVIKLYGNPLSAMKFNTCGEYTTYFKAEKEEEGTLLLTKREKGFTDLLYNPPILLQTDSTRQNDGAVTPPLSNEEVNYIPDVNTNRREKTNTLNSCKDIESVSDPMSIPPSSNSKAISEADLEAAKTVSQLGQQRRSTRQRRTTDKYGLYDEHRPLARRVLPTRNRQNEEDAIVTLHRQEKATNDYPEDEPGTCSLNTEKKESDNQSNISQVSATNATQEENDTVETITNKRNTVCKAILCKCAFRFCKGIEKEKEIPVTPCSRCGNLVHRADCCSAYAARIEESTGEDVVCMECLKNTKYN